MRISIIILSMLVVIGCFQKKEKYPVAVVDGVEYRLSSTGSEDLFLATDRDSIRILGRIVTHLARDYRDSHIGELSELTRAARERRFIDMEKRTGDFIIKYVDGYYVISE